MHISKLYVSEMHFTKEHPQTTHRMHTKRSSSLIQYINIMLICFFSLWKLANTIKNGEGRDATVGISHRAIIQSGFDLFQGMAAQGNQ